MKRKYFWRNFYDYCKLMMVPLLLLFLACMVLVTIQMQKDLNAQAGSTLSSVNTSLDSVVSNVIFQNDQLTNNSSMLLALKKLLLRDTNIDYSEAIYLRNIKTLMRSITQTYPYIDSVYLYLDGYDKFFSSESAVTTFEEEEDQEWLQIYLQMNPEERNYVAVLGTDGQKTITIFQRMLLLDGIVVMDIEIEKYRNLLNQILYSHNETILFYNNEGEYLFQWNEGKENGLEEVLPGMIPDGSDGKWLRLGKKFYMVHESRNNSYRLKIVSLIPQDVIWDNIKGVASVFFLVMGVCVIVLMLLAYRTAKESFDRIEYMVNVFQDAERGNFPKEPKQEEKNEYDVVLNNIIYLFLHNIQLNDSLKQKQQEQEIAELTALQLQINPHFLFNVLQNVEFEMKKVGGANAVCKMVEDLSEILQYALKNPLEPITLRQEIEYLKKYVSIQRKRFGSDFIVYYEIDEELWEFPVFRLMLQPLVENSIVHGVRLCDRPGYIKVKAFARGGRVIFRVVDNGIGMTAEEIQEFQDRLQKINVRHIGMSNVNSRLKIYYGEESAIHVRSRKNRGCVVEFSIPTDGNEYKR